MEISQQRDLESNLRISPKPVILLLALPAVTLSLVAFSLPDATAAMLLSICLYAAVIGLWVLADHRPRLAAWAVSIAIWGTLVAVALVTQTAEMLLLGCLATALAASLAGLRSAFFAASAQALVLLALGLLGAEPWRIVFTGLALDAGALATTVLLVRPVRTLSYWSFQRYERAQLLLDEARERQSELKQALDALAHANRELSLAHDRLAALRLTAEDARRTKASFTSNVSHEFRAPLNIIIGLTEILLDARRAYGLDLPAEARKDVAILQRNCQHLVDLINDVLDLSQIEAHQLALRREWVDLRDIFLSAADIVRPLIKAKGLAFEIELPADLEAVYCDPRRIRQVILNLASNAARFTEQGRIAIAARRDADQVLVSVQDTGPGIRMDDIERIFEPFQQSGSAGAVLGKGSGLGLAISREFVRMHDGNIWVETAPGSGSTFYFRLPVRPAAEPAAGAERWLTSAWFERVRTTQTPAVPVGDRVVIHDDTRRLAGALARYAGDLTLVEAPHADAVPAFCEHESARAVVLCSDEAPTLVAGVQRIAHALQSTPIIGIVIAEAVASDDLLGAIDYVIKPVSAESLQQACERVTPAPGRFLIVDDEADARHVLAAQLRRLYPAVEVKEASSGIEALDVVGAWRPDLILLDVIMPEMDGWQTLAALRKGSDRGAIPTVMVSAQDRYPEPLTGSLLVATIQEGISLGKLIPSIQALSDVLLPRSGAPAATRREMRGDSQAWAPPSSRPG